MLRITDKGFQYTPSFSTDLKKRFRKMIRDQQRATGESPKTPALPAHVLPLARRHTPKS